ncbi:MAG: tetratricopeptide repeat protein [Azonexus sp.]|nr:tetratricopeptide repeat protein [Azonexus sp.]MDP3639275.1 tetratricopeptide repeat protein [Azonexus sp.]MDZ4317001.1 tetratricopeptide repeat protein [Azonexus sp.]
MSLLMDALKRAETSKQEAARTQARGDSASTFGEILSLEPLPSHRPKGAINPLPELATHIEEIDADLAMAASPKVERAKADLPLRPNLTPATEEKPTNQAERDAIRNAFAAKLATEPLSKRPLRIALTILGSAALVIAAYVWLQLNAMNRNTPAAPVNRSSISASSQPAHAVAINTPPVFVPFSQSTAGQADTSITAAPMPPSAEPPLFAAPRPAYRPAPTEPRAESTAGAESIRLTRTHPEPDANLLRGHQHIAQNELNRARGDFEQALRRDPNNTDALLALAAIAQRQGRASEAEYIYQRAMIANPSDAAVQAALLGSAAAATDPQTTESRLKMLLSTQPESAPLNFTLGNLYARQGRWAEAQQVYFNAVAVEADHPDYLFNLAVSLDHIRQTRPAAQHYRLALEAAAKRPAAFDREQVKKRLAELQLVPPR